MIEIWVRRGFAVNYDVKLFLNGWLQVETKIKWVSKKCSTLMGCVKPKCNRPEVRIVSVKINV